MDCREIQNRIDAYLDGATGPDENARIREHLGNCASCRRLEALLRGDADLNDHAAPRDLVDGVLARTVGSPCARAQDLLPGREDGTLEPVDRELVALHLERCRDCAALSKALERLTAWLPALAEREPDDAFLTGVLARTTNRKTTFERLVSRWRQTADRLWRRPRLALEGAYVGMLVMLALFAAPLSPFRDVPSRAVAAIRAEFSEPVLQPALARLDSRVSTESRQAWGAARGAVTARQELRCIVLRERSLRA